MKPENEHTRHNISRLVKRTRPDQSPPGAFTEALIDEALQKLDLSDASQTGSGGKTTMKRTSTARMIGYAATVLLVFGLVVFFNLPSLNRVRRYDSSTSMNVPKQTFSEPEDQAPVVALEPSAPSERPVLIGTPPSQPMPDVSAQAVASGTGGRQPQGTPGRSLIPHLEPLGLDAKSKEFSHMAHGGTTPPNGEPVDAMFFQNYGVNPFVDTEDDRLSTFATDTDSASYTMARQYLMQGHRVPKDAVRVEEFVNAFDYDYPSPEEGDFALYMEACEWPFAGSRKDSHLLRIGLKTREISRSQRKPAILTFVIDVSGSMQRENRLGLVKKSLSLLVDQLRPDDQIGIAVYGSRGRKVMDHETVEQRTSILAAIDSLHSEGSTNAEEGIRIGYDMADEAFRTGCINRVILCSDGVANVGRTGPEAILEMIKNKTDKGITLSALGFGMGNYNDVLLEQLGNKGNGSYAYIDTLQQARALFEHNLVGTLQVIARDVKIQVEFNPKVVRSYRLIGYENRAVPDDKFRDDTYDGGEIGAGHSTTALYEVKLWNRMWGRLATTFVRYKHADTFRPSEFAVPFSIRQVTPHFRDTSPQFRQAALAAQFAEVLRESYWAQDQNIDALLAPANTLLQELDFQPQCSEFLRLMSQARPLYDRDQSTSEADERL